MSRVFPILVRGAALAIALAGFATVAIAAPDNNQGNAKTAAPINQGLKMIDHKVGNGATAVEGKIVVVHYQGGSNQVLVDLLAGRLNLAFNVAATMAPHVENGALVALGVAQPGRTRLLPTVPTMAEQGLPGFDAGVWIGLLAPPGTPVPIVDLLAATSSAAVKSEAIIKVLDAQGMDALGGTPAAFAAFIADDIAKWTKVVTSAGLYE